LPGSASGEEWYEVAPGDSVTLEKVLDQLNLTDEDHNALAEQIGEALDQAEQNYSTLWQARVQPVINEGHQQAFGSPRWVA
jgi:hypothetical protein